MPALKSKPMPSLSRRVLRNRITRQTSTDQMEAAKVAEFQFIAGIMHLAAWTAGLGDILPTAIQDAGSGGGGVFRGCTTRGQELRHLADLSDLIDLGDGYMVTDDGMMDDADSFPQAKRDATNDYPLLRAAVDRIAARVVKRNSRSIS